jgi:hypothetical protein
MPAVDQHPLGSPATMLDFHRRGLLSIAYGTACRARRARHIEQLDAVDVGSPEARDVIQAARDAIHTVADQLDDLGA